MSETIITHVSKWAEKRKKGLKQVVYLTAIGKNKKGKPIYSSQTRHIKA